MRQSTPDVTVVLPTHNRRELLSRAIASVLRQEDVQLELVVVDDGSVDGTWDSLQRLRDERVRPFRVEHAQGVARARNLAISEARGGWLAFLDDDDFWAPAKLRRQLAEGSAARGVLVYSKAAVLDGEGLVKRFTEPGGPNDLDRMLLETNTIGTPSGVLARTEAVRKVGGFDERLSVFADWDLWLQLLQRGRAALIDEPLFAYVEHPANMNVTQIGSARAELRYMARKHRALTRAHGVRFGSLHLSRWLVSRYRPEGRRLDAAREYASIALRHRSPRDMGRAFGMLLGERLTNFGRGIVGAAPDEEEETPPLFNPTWLPRALSGDAFSGAV